MPPEVDRSGSDWQLVAASVAGRAHERRGVGNQDAFAAATAADGSLLLAVADGAGSAERSAEGARVAADTAVASLAAGGALDSGARLLAAFRQARSAVSRKAERSGIPVREYASTLLLVCAGADSVGALQLGDGAVVIRSGPDVSRLTPPWRSAYAGETVFLTSPGAEEHLRFTHRPGAGLDGIALLTDGLEPVATDLQSGAPYAPFFAPLFTFAAGEATAASQGPRNRELARLLASDRIRSRTHDDTTLVLAVRRTGA